VRVNRFLLQSALVAAVAGFLFGFDTIVISGTTEMLTERFGLTPWMLGWTVASALIGTILGSLITGKPAEWVGRKPVLMSLSVLYFVSAIGCGLAWNWFSLLAFRVVGGIAIGGASVVSPTYIAEISPPHVRGRLVATSQLNIVAGLVAAYISNFVIAWLMPGNPEAWRWMLGIVAAPSVLFFFLLLPIPESPRWLAKRHRREEALSVLKRLGNDDPEGLLGEIVESLHEETVGMDEPFFRRKYLKPILLAFMVASFNQLAGINAVLYYSGHIFRMAGAGQTSQLAQSIIIGMTNLIFTLIGLAVIDHFGRRKLMIVGAVGLAFSQAATAYAFWMTDQMAAGGISQSHEVMVGRLVLGSLIGFIAFFAFSNGAVIWVYISEIFPNRVRARGQALGSFTHWFWCALINFSFPVIVANVSKSAPFAFFSAMMVLQLVLVWKYMPETKGVSLEEMQRHLGIE
jgi:MFS transporter, SP family, xylose:H+ symportor